MFNASFPDTQRVVAEQVIHSSDLNYTAAEYDVLFIKPLLSNSGVSAKSSSAGTTNSRPGSAEGYFRHCCLNSSYLPPYLKGFPEKVMSLQMSE